MSQFRSPRESNKYYIPREEFLTVVHFCRQYPTWEAELKANPDTGTGVDTEKEHVQTSNISDPTSDLGIHRATIARKKKLVDDTALKVAGAGLCEWLILGVCHGMPYYQLDMRGIRCSAKSYYKMRQRFYFEMSKNI